MVVRGNLIAPQNRRLTPCPIVSLDFVPCRVPAGIKGVPIARAATLSVSTTAVFEIRVTRPDALRKSIARERARSSLSL